MPKFTVHHNPTIDTKASTEKGRNGHSTHVIGDASFVEIVIKSKKGDFLCFFSSYQMLTMAKNLRSYYARTMLVKSGHTCGTIAAKLLTQHYIKSPRA